VFVGRHPFHNYTPRSHAAGQMESKEQKGGCEALLLLCEALLPTCSLLLARIILRPHYFAHWAHEHGQHTSIL